MPSDSFVVAPGVSGQDVLPPKRAWAMRTSRASEAHRRCVVMEVQAGRLRQGWGFDETQDLRIIKEQIEASGWGALSADQKAAWGHWRMLGEDSSNPQDAMCIGDWVILPNVPDDRS